MRYQRKKSLSSHPTEPSPGGEDLYLVREIFFQPDPGGFCSPGAYIYVVGTLQHKKDKHSSTAVTLEIPFDHVEVKDAAPREKATLLLRHRVVSWDGNSGNSGGSRRELDLAILTLSPDIKFLTPANVKTIAA